jgi:2-keto-4-pentenoate hydratase/2-oxohepta-3-ene-1,7-dioic acid hydratase in catechol pathway
MKIICIGRNYVDHAKELNNPLPSKPIIFMKPPTALLLDNKPFYYPDFTKNLHHEAEIVLKICKNGRHVEPEFASTYYREIGIGIDFTARDLQDQLKSKGHPWEIAKAFDFSAPLSKFIPLDSLNDPADIHFTLTKNDTLVQNGNTKDLIFSFDELICHISKFFRLQIGDYIYTGTPAGVGPVEIGDTLVCAIEGKEMLTCEIK